MNTQNFHNDVDQVAAGDIHNHFDNEPKSLWNCTLEELKEERAFSWKKKWQLQRKLLFSLPMAVLILGLLVLFSNAVYGLWSFTIFGKEMHGWAIGTGFVVASVLLFSIPIEQTSKGIAFHTQRLKMIDTIMQAKF